uniref:Uncharacterized protein n=1 Tax=Bionectria ochroleuca TaxID=29856 RepID=A0A8H7NHR7_BIOOC
MGADEALDAVLGHHLDELTQIGDVLQVQIGGRVGARMANRLPRHQQADKRQSPRLQTAEVKRRLVQGEGPAGEGHGAVLVEAIGEVRQAIGGGGQLAGA